MISFEMRCAIRRAKHRPEFRARIDQFDVTAGRIVNMGCRPDPMLDLYAARANRNRDAYNAQRYGEIRQRVVSPVWLP
ncbi:hypothetical protein [Luteibacter sp.]|uniref:hypothetical protein n=1 Tax=Luteibacter sp. TaxID=1886636 RepID=UPI00280799E5|nr:hypothetical protein [Luteibacter sp.]MDQ8050714.1 hypothetical protein [Luteibacter sp.]